MQTYKELLKEGEKLNDTNFCSVVALSTLADISFKRAKRKLEKAGVRTHGAGADVMGFLKVLQNQGKTVSAIQVSGTMTANQATKRFKTGKYFVVFNGSICHCSALVNGKYNDWIDQSVRGKAPRYKIALILKITDNNA